MNVCSIFPRSSPFFCFSAFPTIFRQNYEKVSFIFKLLFAFRQAKKPPSARSALLSSASGPADLFIENSSLSLQKLCLFIDSRPPYSIGGGNE
jgi:hypothetical protein